MHLIDLIDLIDQIDQIDQIKLDQMRLDQVRIDRYRQIQTKSGHRASDTETRVGIRVGGLNLVEIHVVCLLSTDSFVLYLFYLRGALYYLHKSPVLKFLHPKPRRNDDNMLFGFIWRNILCQGVVMPFECFFCAILRCFRVYVASIPQIRTFSLAALSSKF